MNAQATKQDPKQDVKPAFDKAAYIKAHGGTISGAVRALAAEGKSRSDIKNLLGIRYQWVRNVLITPIKKPVNKTESPAPVETK